MEKKSLNRSSQLQSRASAVDCKKSTGKCAQSKSHILFACVIDVIDVIIFVDLTFKPWPRHNKKREVLNNAQKNDASRKNIPPVRGRGQLDRRQRVRENNGFVLGGTSGTGYA